MRTTIITACCLLAAALGSSAQTPAPESGKPPGNGDEVVVKGCLRGVTLEATEVGRRGADPSSMPYTFQLKGKKDLLKELRAKHDNQVVDLTGILKSHLTSVDPRGKQFGRTRIVVGIDSTTPGVNPAGVPDQPMPVLEVKGFEGTGVSCGR